MIRILSSNKSKEIMAKYFHYTSGNGLYGILTTDRLQCTNINFLNDPTENKYLNMLLEDLFSENLSFKQLYNNLFDTYLPENLYPGNHFIASFSKKGDSLHMWNYYAKGNGYNLEIDLISILEKNSDVFDTITKEDIIYDPAEQKRVLTEIFIKYQKLIDNIITDKTLDEDMFNMLYGSELTLLSIQFTEELSRFRFLFKHTAYRHEEESRLVIGINESNYQKYVEYKVSNNGVILEFISIVLDLKNNLKSIKIHPAATDLHIAGVQKLVNSKVGFLNQKKITKSNVPFRIV